MPHTALRKPALYEKAIQLRRDGLSYGDILQHVPVGNGTISRWCHNIQLTEKQKERLRQNKSNTILIRTLKEKAAISKQEALRWSEERIQGLKNIKMDELLIFAGALLYWAEGSKLNEDREGHKGIEFTNTDPRMIKIMMKFFRETVCVPEPKLKIVVRIGKNGELEKAQQFWSQITGIPLNNFRRPELLTLGDKSKSLIKYPHGMCRIVIHDISLARKIAALINNAVKIFSD